MSGIQLQDGCKLAINSKKDNNVTICRHDVFVKLFWRCRVSIVNFRYWSNFYVNIMTGSGFLFVKDWPKIQKSEITPSEYCSISLDWGKLEIPKLSLMSLIKRYWIPLNTGENSQPPPHPHPHCISAGSAPQILSLKNECSFCFSNS